MQKKKQSKGCPSALENTGDHLFIANQKIEFRSRAQYIRNVHTRGRAYDILSGARITTIPPTVPERL